MTTAAQAQSSTTAGWFTPAPWKYAGLLIISDHNDLSIARLHATRGWSWSDLSDKAERVGNHADKGLPGARVAIWAGFDPRAEVDIEGRAYLFNHNDHGRTFAEIADAIEAQL